MRKKQFTKVVTLLAATAAVCMPAHGDEGMWTLYNLPQAVYDEMVQEGFQLPYNSLYAGQDALKNAVVNFSGYCSGVVVSPNGLVFTNHHCGFSAINAHSTEEHDYMLNGFYAKDYSEELPNENMFVSFMKDQKDVTARVQNVIKGMTGTAAGAAIDSIANVMTDSVKNIDNTLHVEIDAFYEGNKYYATTYQKFDDIRLVFTVPKSMGKYGGETDNWMWPRQTCDFSVFRIYADPKTTGPAEYSKNNVPYHPKHWAPVSLQGYKDGDFSMTVGYPGSTERYLSSYGIQQMRDIDNTTRVQARTIKLALMKKYMDQSEKTRIQYEDKYVGAANYWKNSMGMNKCIDSIGLIRQKQEYEAKIRQWQLQNPTLSEKVDFDLLQKLYAKEAESAKASSYMGESFFRTSEFFARAIKICNGMEAKGPKDNPKKQYVEFDDNSNEWNLQLDKELTCAMLKNYAENAPARFLPKFYTTIKNKFGGDYKKYTDYLYDKSGLMKPGYKFYDHKKNFAKDPGVAMGFDIMEVISALREELYPLPDSISEQEKHLCAAKIRMEEDMSHYSDANFTMRLSYGQVGGYLIGGYKSGYYTDAASIVEKMKRGNEVEEYKAEPIMMQLMSQKDFGRYQDKTTGKMQLCFLTNNDITGGNSGSPMFDGRGRLIGLAFDGNWDSLASDINFDRQLARCIGVDIRYVLFMMDKWGHADRLLQEINPQ